MRDPGAVVPGLHFAQFVLAHFRQRLFVRHRIVLDGNLRGHSAHGVSAAAVAGLDQQLHVGSAGSGCVMVTSARFGRMKSGRLLNFLMKLKM